MASTVATHGTPGAPGVLARLRGGPAALRRRIPAAAGRFLARASAPAHAPAKRLGQIPLFVAGIGCIDAAPFTHGPHMIVGLLVTGLSLLGLEYVIADEDEA